MRKNQRVQMQRCLKAIKRRKNFIKYVYTQTYKRVHGVVPDWDFGTEISWDERMAVLYAKADEMVNRFRDNR